MKDLEDLGKELAESKKKGKASEKEDKGGEGDSESSSTSESEDESGDEFVSKEDYDKVMKENEALGKLVGEQKAKIKALKDNVDNLTKVNHALKTDLEIAKRHLKKANEDIVQARKTPAILGIQGTKSIPPK